MLYGESPYSAPYHIVCGCCASNKNNNHSHHHQHWCRHRTQPPSRRMAGRGATQHHAAAGSGGPDGRNASETHSFAKRRITSKRPATMRETHCSRDAVPTQVDYSRSSDQSTSNAYRKHVDNQPTNNSCFARKATHAVNSQKIYPARSKITRSRTPGLMNVVQMMTFEQLQLKKLVMANTPHMPRASL